MPSMSITVQSSFTWPSATRLTLMPATVNGLPVGGMLWEWAAVGTAVRPAVDHPVALGDQILDAHAQVREGRAKARQELFVRGAVEVRYTTHVADIVDRGEFVERNRVAFVERPLQVVADELFDLFGRAQPPMARWAEARLTCRRADGGQPTGVDRRARDAGAALLRAALVGFLTHRSGHTIAG
jgi:hypothetical protein